jgi:hypothetical protein
LKHLKHNKDIVEIAEIVETLGDMSRPANLSDWSFGSALWREDLFQDDALPLASEQPLSDRQLMKQYGWMSAMEANQARGAMQSMGRPLTIAEQRAMRPSRAGLGFFTLPSLPLITLFQPKKWVMDRPINHTAWLDDQTAKGPCKATSDAQRAAEDANAAYYNQHGKPSDEGRQKARDARTAHNACGDEALAFQKAEIIDDLDSTKYVLGADIEREQFKAALRIHQGLTEAEVRAIMPKWDNNRSSASLQGQAVEDKYLLDTRRQAERGEYGIFFTKKVKIALAAAGGLALLGAGYYYLG